MRTDMRSTEIQRLVDEVESRYGTVTLYGSDPSAEHGTCFIISGVPATFSVHTQDRQLPPEDYDVQIEGIPPGDYIFSSVVSLGTFLELVERMRGPEKQRPGINEEKS
jgi:hypothetical protein